MVVAAERLIDWRVANAIGRRVAGVGVPMSSLERAKVGEDFAELVPEAERMVSRFTKLEPGQYRSRPWVMTRGEWIEVNLRGFERVLEPLAERVLAVVREGPSAGLRRAALGAQVGGLLGYLGHKVLGQYDLFLPADDDGILYFVGPNVVAVERRYRFPAREFRLWLALHEVAHRLQFGGVPWLRGHVSGLVDSYLATIDLDPKELIQSLRRAVDEIRSGAEWRGLGWIFLLMTPEQRDMFRRMQAVMTLLEGHGNFVMDAVARRHRLPSVATFKRRLHERRHKTGVEAAFQKVIGFDSKVRQYDLGERFVARVVDRVGMDGFNRVWEAAENLPTLEEVGRPEVWVARVGAG